MTFSLETNKNGNLSLSYLQRVIRPYGADLNPFIQYGDPTHLTQGNPDLKDEFIHSLELSYSLVTKSFRFTPALYYRNKSNRIMEIMNEESIWQKTNIGHSQALGFELSGNWNPIRILNIGFPEMSIKMRSTGVRSAMMKRNRWFARIGRGV